MNDYILEMLNISKAFAGVQALRDVSIRCRPGKVYGLVGENGAGKSTLMKILAGAYKADAGEIIYKGERRDQASAGDVIDSGISIIYQELALVQQMSVAENIFLGREPRYTLGVLNLKELHRGAAALLKRLGISSRYGFASQRANGRAASIGGDCQGAFSECRFDRHG